MNYKYSQFRHGMKCTCEIDGTKITDAKISINRDGQVYICQNKENGATATNKLGYKYSWLILSKNEDFEEDMQDVTNLILKGVSKPKMEKMKYAVSYELESDPTEFFTTKAKAMDRIEELIDKGATDIYLIELGKVYKVRKTGFELKEV